MRIKMFHALLLLSVMGCLVACKKDAAASAGGGSGSGYYFREYRDGAWVNFTGVNGGIGPDGYDPSKTDLALQGTIGVSDVLSVDLQVSGSSFPTGVYNSDSSAYETFVSEYFPLTGKDFEIQDSSYPVVTHSKYIVTISNITGTTITGTFTGTYLNDNFDDTSINVTQGQFYVHRLY
jgi:hypothetical protein